MRAGTICFLTRLKMHRAATLHATGMVLRDVAAELGVTHDAVKNWTKRHKKEWQKLLAEAVEDIAFEPIDGAPEPEPRMPPSVTMTLPEFFRSFIRPCLLDPSGTKPRTIDLYEESLKFWAKYTGNPPLANIGAETCAAFIMGLSHRTSRRGPGILVTEPRPISPNTIRRHGRNIQFILDRAGPRNRYSPDAAGLLPDAPYIRVPRARKKITLDAFTVDEIRRIIDACDRMTSPARLGDLAGAEWDARRGAWWQALIRFVFYTGLRIGSVLAAKWDWVERDEFGNDWLVVPGDLYKGGQPHRFFLSAGALEALASFERLIGRRDTIIGWPYGLPALQDPRRALVGLARIPPARRFGFHALRKALGTELWRIDPGAAQMALGHTINSTTMNHYVRPDMVAGAMNAVPMV
ncbi:MAG: tyrosine-type recombinase/integrase [Pirellulales bacterium]|nr:tyrosine-type recombinase/integrase [Pirellulales bacterium]